MNQLNRRRRNVAAIVFILILAILAVFLYSPAKEQKQPPAPGAVKQTEGLQKESARQEFEDASFEGNGKWYGLCKKNSIHSLDDFRKAVLSDPVLKTHFTGFKWENAKMGRLDKATRAYVYYRKDDTIFRKKTPITLPAGDGYITDGDTTVRTMCCNSYAAAPPAYAEPELEAEPAAGPQPLNVNTYPAPPEPAETLIPEELIGRTLADSRIVVPPVIIPHHTPDDRPHPPSHDHPEEPKEPPPKPPRPVPIVAPILLLGTGLLALTGIKRRFRK
ncbi:hypothetical protein [Syntrophus sp. (in: bacteria)]|jgi:hypothetical protein|uniref:hypothetical protein n=1 Tax=Syntrophus sp. (in: bacteria) TaxID=48412 RepID=UPI00345E3C31